MPDDPHLLDMGEGVRGVYGMVQFSCKPVCLVIGTSALTLNHIPTPYRALGQPIVGNKAQQLFHLWFQHLTSLTTLVDLWTTCQDLSCSF